MVLASKFLFRIPQSETWYSSLDEIRCAPTQTVAVKEILGTYPTNWKHKAHHGSMPLDLARAKFS